MLEKLASRAALSQQDCAALLSIPTTEHYYSKGKYIVRNGGISENVSVIVSGVALQYKLTGSGSRQIVSILFPGEIVDSHTIFFGRADTSTQALTHCIVARIPRGELRILKSRHPAIADAMFVSALVDASIQREWILNIGKRSARARIAHFFCEFAARSDVQGIAPGQPYKLPMTQEQLGDALGLTGVHVNRTIKRLVRDGLVKQDYRVISFPDWNLLKREAGFDSRCLYLDQPVVLEAAL